MTDDRDETVQVTHRIPKHVRDAAQEATERGVLSEAVRNVYRAAAHGETFDGHERVAAELASIDAERERLSAQREHADERLATLEERRADLESVSDREADRSTDYEAELDQIEADLHDGMHVFEEHGVVQQAAQAGGVTPAEVIEELKERNPEVPDYAFVARHESDYRWTGTEQPQSH